LLSPDNLESARPFFSPSLAEYNILSGKSLFLLWLFFRRLALGLPTALQVDDAYALLFHEGGVHQFEDPNNNVACDALVFPSGEHPKRIWALVNTSQNLSEPAKVFKDGPFFVVDATYPRSNRLEWVNEARYENFCMRPWSLSEVIQACVDLASGGSQN
jgi:hypothetical protein